VGAQLPAHTSALGKALLAFAAPEVVEDLVAEELPRLTRRTLTAAALRRELDAVRERGVARERDEAVLGEASLAAPIFDHAGHAVGAIGVVGETSVILPRAPSAELQAAVIEAARGISRELGASRWPPVR
jgi:DNA-binding IclR family transcriptional regulator